MIYLDTNFSDSIEKAKILNADSLQFENGFAVAKVYVESNDWYHGKDSYETFTIIQEVKDNSGMVIDYKILDPHHKYLKLPKYVCGITQVGNNFFFDILTGDEYHSYNSYYHYVLTKSQSSIEEVGDVLGNAKKTKNKDVVILGDCCLYSLSRRGNVSKRYACIEDVDGEKFFVTDVVHANNDKRLTDHLLFDINSRGKRLSDVYSRNARTFIKCSLNLPYDKVKEKAIKELDETIDAEQKQKLILMQNNTKE